MRRSKAYPCFRASSLSLSLLGTLPTNPCTKATHFAKPLKIRRSRITPFIHCHSNSTSAHGVQRQSSRSNHGNKPPGGNHKLARSDRTTTTLYIPLAEMLFWLSVFALLALLVMRTFCLIRCSFSERLIITEYYSDISVPRHSHLPCPQPGEVSLPEAEPLHSPVDL